MNDHFNYGFYSSKEARDTEKQIETTEIPSKKNENKQSWVDSVLTCIKPVLGLINRDFHSLDDVRGDNSWEIPFEIISDLEWLGEY